jgi:mono/diheme cytochrome c family protein
VKGLLIIAGIMAATLGAAERKPLPWEKSRLALGQALYRENCVVCHDIDTAATKKPGPSLHRLFKNPRLPLSKGKPNRPYVIVRIKFGGPLMPAFQKKLTDADIDLLLEYIESK